MSATNLMGEANDVTGIDAIPAHELHIHEHFAKHASQNNQRLRPGEFGFAHQQKELGTSAASDAPPELDADAQRAVDQALAPPTSITEYRIPMAQTNADDLGVMQEVKNAGTWMRDAGLPGPIGHQVATEMFKLGAIEPNESELAHMGKQLHHDLQKSWGTDYRANLDSVTRLINEVDRKHSGKVWEYLDAHPAMLSSPAVVKMLSNHARRVYGSR